ncbi:hypothetical protein AAG645_31030, partial [Pseudomonas aeruginosa]
MAAGRSVIFRRRLHQLIGRNGCCAAGSVAKIGGSQR